MSKYKVEVYERKNFLRSLFFRSIYKKTKILIKDEDACLQETKEKINNLKSIFDKGIKESNLKILENCLKAFKGKNINDELNKEIEILEKILGINNKYDKNKLFENLKILFQKEEALSTVNSLKTFILITGVKKTEFYEMINNIIISISKNKDIYNIKKFIKELEYYNILSFKNNNNFENTYIQILKKLKEQPDAIKYLFETNKDNIQHMHELNLENDSEFITNNDILDFEKCIDFMRKLGNINEIKKLTDKELIVNFRNLVNENNKDGKIELLFNKYINNYGELMQLMNRGIGNAEISKKKIGFILQNSKFHFINKKDFFICNYYQKNKNNEIETKTLNMEKLLELRDKAQLTKILSGDDKEKEIIKKNQEFIEIVSKITFIYELFLEIYKKGYPNEISAEIKITSGNI